VLHFERKDLPIVVVSLLVKASPLQEAKEKAGLANLTANMLTEGTERRSSREISGAIEFIGANIAASVEEDFTLVTLSVLKKDVEKGFDIFSDVVRYPGFPEEELVRKKELITGALRQREEEPAYVAEKAFKGAVYGEHPYGRPVMGDPLAVRDITGRDVAFFHESFYRPNNSIMSVAGDLSAEELDGLLRKYFAGWKQAPVPQAVDHEPPSISSAQVIKIDRDLSQANILLGHLGVERSNPDYYAVSVMNYILGGGGFSSRLMQSVRDEMGLAYSIYSAFIPSKGKGVFEAVAQTKNESANTVIEEILKQMERMQTTPVGGQELKDASSYLTGSFPRRLDTLAKIANFLSVVEFYGLGLDYDQRYPEYIRSVTIEDVMRVARTYLHPDRCILVVVADQGKAGVRDSR
ncbi:MAG: M16 family metallopeptidase, partial [Thermodesulfovibrionales bacterium]